MKKIFASILIAILIVLFSASTLTFAATANYNQIINNPDWQTIYMICPLPGSPQGSSYTILCGTGYISVSQNGSSFTFSYGYSMYSYIFSEYPPDSSMAVIQNNAGYYITYSNVNLVLLKGTNQLTPNDYYFQSKEAYEDYINPPPPPPDPTWYESLFSDFIDYVGAGIAGGIEGFLDWLTDAWTIPVGYGEDELYLDLVTPTPEPTPLPTPTPIPYTTTFVPDGSGGFNVTYNYYDNNGNPTSAPMPPTNSPVVTSVPVQGDDFDYPYYNNPNNSDDPYELDIPWYLKFKFNGVTTSLNDFQGGIDATIDTVNDQEDNINVVMDSVGLLPSDWLLLIGFIGGIPLIGGLISRLLKG